MILLGRWCTCLQCRLTSVSLWMVQDLLITSCTAFSNEHALVLVWRASPHSSAWNYAIAWVLVSWMAGVWREAASLVCCSHYSVCVCETEGNNADTLLHSVRVNCYKDAFGFHVREPVNWFLHWQRPLYSWVQNNCASYAPPFRAQWLLYVKLAATDIWAQSPYRRNFKLLLSFYGTQLLITMFIKVRHWSTLWSRLI